ncbi:MAG: hypothetical protein J6K51_04715 [Clostridia bacterium]|nr:hypothetical protein [Clostridia bacterium]
MKNPVYGMEKDYLSQLSKELLIYTDDTCFDGFSNLIAKRNGTKSVVVGFGASENAFLVSEIMENGKVKVSPLFPVAEACSGQRVLSPNGKQGIFDAKENTVDFFTESEAKTLRVVKPGDVIYLKPFLETVGDSYLTNELCWFWKHIFTEFLKTKNTRVSIAFIRETKKGAYALGKNFLCDEAYFVTCQKNLPHPVCFLKKEGDYVSPMALAALPSFISEKEISLANAYFGASGCHNTAGIVLNCEELPAGQWKIKKETVKALFDFLETLN